MPNTPNSWTQTTIVVDTTGLMIRAVVHSAEIRDADGAELIFAKVKESVGD